MSFADVPLPIWIILLAMLIAVGVLTTVALRTQKQVKILTEDLNTAYGYLKEDDESLKSVKRTLTTLTRRVATMRERMETVTRPPVPPNVPSTVPTLKKVGKHSYVMPPVPKKES